MTMSPARPRPAFIIIVMIRVPTAEDRRAKAQGVHGDTRYGVDGSTC